MISPAEARVLIGEHVQPLGTERVKLAAAHGRVLAESVATMEDIPAFDRSAMDGYAVPDEGRSERYRVVMEVAAGVKPSRRLEAGECARIFTGGALPEGAARVIMQEQTRRDGEWMIPMGIDDAKHIRFRGEDAKAGQLLLHAGRRLGAVEVSLLAQLGMSEPLIRRRPRVIHIATGGELVDPAETPEFGQIRDSNSSLVAGLLAEFGAEVVRQERCGDDIERMLAAIDWVPRDGWDLLLISGGASVGDHDFGRAALVRMGFKIHFHGLNLRPGKPLIFGTRGGQCAFVIPGNPLSHLVCFHVVIREALDAAQLVERERVVVHLPLAAQKPLKGNPRETWWPGRLNWVRDGGAGRAICEVSPCRWQSSGDCTDLAGVNALFKIPAGSSGVHPGEFVECLLLDRR